MHAMRSHMASAAPATEQALFTVHDITQALKNQDVQMQCNSVRVLDHYAATTIAS